jgi:carbamoyltransferase
MYILGINSGLNKEFFHDASACLIKDGKLVAFAEQERFDRVKHSYHFPKEAIDFCLKFANIKYDDVDFVAMDIILKKFITSAFSSMNLRMFNPDNLYGRLLNFNIFFANSKVKQNLKKIFPEKKVFDIPHHLSHAASAFYVSGFNRSNILTLDGRGESETTAFFKGEENRIEKVWDKSFFNNHSFGVCYRILTGILNLGDYGEGKTMGLAPYGKPVVDFSDIVAYNGSYKTCLADFSKIRWRFSKFRRKEGEELNNIHKNLAASLQKSLEETISKIIEEITITTNCRTLCLAGGVALNCKTNGVIIESGLVDDIFIQPAAGDAGGALGAALQAYVELGYKPKTKMEHAYWGPEFSNEEIEAELKKQNQKFEFHDDIAGTVAELISKGKIVGWFQGRMEIGPRALGNRSIVADPRDLKMWKKVNDVKGREAWRPLAPSMLGEAIEEYFENPYPSPFMILSFTVKKEKVKDIQAAVHVDRTTRPQTVTKKSNPLYYDLIKNFEKITSVPVILNTSFNDKSEPIVCTPADAIRTLHKTGLDHLAIGNYLVSK